MSFSYNIVDSSGTVDPNLQAFIGGGVVTLAGAIDRLRVTSVAANTFDGGSVNIMWE